MKKYSQHNCTVYQLKTLQCIYIQFKESKLRLEATKKTANARFFCACVLPLSNKCFLVASRYCHLCSLFAFD